MRKKIIVLGAVVGVTTAAFAVGMRFQSFRAHQATPAQDEDVHAYERNFARAVSLLSENTIAVTDLADSVSRNWIQAVALGLNSTQQVERVFSDLESSGARPRLTQAHQELETRMQTLKDAPFSFRTAYGVLEDTYAVYAELFKLSLHPSGSLVIFNKQVQQLQDDLAQKFNRLTLYTPKAAPSVPAQGPGQEKTIVLAQQEAQAPAAADNDRLGGKTEEQIQQIFGAPVNEEHAEAAGGTQKLYRYKGKDITVYYKNEVVTGWTE